jgi:hypothetical protein
MAVLRRPRHYPPPRNRQWLPRRSRRRNDRSQNRRQGRTLGLEPPPRPRRKHHRTTRVLVDRLDLRRVRKDHRQGLMAITAPKPPRLPQPAGHMGIHRIRDRANDYRQWQGNTHRRRINPPCRAAGNTARQGTNHHSRPGTSQKWGGPPPRTRHSDHSPAADRRSTRHNPQEPLLRGTRERRRPPPRGSTTNNSATLKHRFPLQRENQEGRHVTCRPSACASSAADDTSTG